MPVLSLEGTELYYEDDGAGIPVLFLHGMGLDARMWDDQVTALAGEARLIRPDLRGFGRSPRDSSTAYSHVADLLALLDHLGLDQVVLVGLSMGGMIGLEVVLAAPDRVRSLVLLDSVIDESRSTPTPRRSSGTSAWPFAKVECRRPARSGSTAASSSLPAAGPQSPRGWPR